MAVRWTIILFIIAGIAAIFAFSNIAEGIAPIAKIIFFIFLIAAYVPILVDRR